MLYSYFCYQKPSSRFNLHSLNVLENLNRLEIYEHQKAALQQLKGWFENISERIALVLIPTGGGKSGVAALAPYVLNTTRVLIITPSNQITKQLADDFGRVPSNSFYAERNIVTREDAKDFVEPPRTVNKGQQVEDLADNLLIVNAQKFGTNSTIDWTKLNPERFNLLIVDEAHHYPAPTWEKIVQYFSCKTIFLTATPYRCDVPLSERPDTVVCHRSTRDQLVTAGVIRELEFKEVGSDSDSEERRWMTVYEEILNTFNDHDGQDGSFEHKAMVLTRYIDEAKKFAQLVNNDSKDRVDKKLAAAYTGETADGEVMLDQFDKGPIRILVVCGKLLEGYNQKKVSVCAILRKVAPTSKVLFTQFVGRCLRKFHQNDTVKAKLISHVYYQQQQNYDDLEEIAEVDPDDEDEQ